MNSKILALIGVVLIVAAWFSAKVIPLEANEDFNRLVRKSGGVMSHSPDFPGMYKQICANSRMLQNAYVGVAGLICLAVGLAGMHRKSE